jgi:dihydroxyacetone kinase
MRISSCSESSANTFAVGRQTAKVVIDDDVAVEASTWSTGRRGVAGTLILEKIVGAAAERGADLATLQALGTRVNARTRSMGVALTSCTVPAAGRPTFTLGEDEMESAARRVLMASGVRVTRYLTGSYVTSLDMAGCSLTMTMLDEELAALGRASTYARAALVTRTTTAPAR